MRLNVFLSSVLLGFASLLVAPLSTHAATVSSIEYLKLSNGSHTGGTGVTFTKPDNLLIDFLSTIQPSTQSSVGVNSTRDNAQTFTIDAIEYPQGVLASGFALNFEKRTDAAMTFGVELFQVSNANGANIPASNDPGITFLVLNSESGPGSLTFDTATVLGHVSGNNNTGGTVIFNFNEPVFLAAGSSYAFRTKPTSATNTVDFDVAETAPLSLNYLGGQRYQGDAAIAAQPQGTATGGDFNFGLIGVSVPEPCSSIYVIIGMTSLGLMRARQKN